MPSFALEFLIVQLFTKSEDHCTGPTARFPTPSQLRFSKVAPRPGARVVDQKFSQLFSDPLPHCYPSKATSLWYNKQFLSVRISQITAQGPGLASPSLEESVPDILTSMIRILTDNFCLGYYRC